MTSRLFSSPPSRLRRATLLLAALLHLFGAAALPVLHATVEARWAADQEKQGQPVPQHDEQHCVLCQGMGAPALPEPSAVFGQAPERRTVLRSEDLSAAPVRLSSSLRARAPPALL